MAKNSIDWCLPVLDSYYQWLSSLPTPWANTITMVMFGVLLIILWSFPKNLILGDAPDQAKWRDLRWWGTLLIVLQLGIYTLFR